MARLFSFSSSLFDPAEEPENPINPIAGHAVLDWLAGKLEERGCVTSRPPAEEDWGWYLDVEMGAARYMIGSSGDSDLKNGSADWMLQVHKKRSIKDRLLGRNRLTEDEELLAVLTGILGDEPGIEEIQIDSDV